MGAFRKMTKKILIVEDEFQIIKLITAILSQKGYEIDYCENGRDAIAKMQDFKPDLVLMDIMLPGIDGKTLAKQMLSIRDLASIPVIIISSLTFILIKILLLSSFFFLLSFILRLKAVSVYNTVITKEKKKKREEEYYYYKK